MLSYLVERSGVAPGWLLVAVIGIAVVSYALGCCNGAVMVSRGILKDDIRKHGSGNGGLTNFCRIHGGILSVLVILIDVLKAVISVFLAGYIFAALSPEMVPAAKYWAGFCCILGHMFPITFQFRGGKGVMSSGAIAIMIDWRLALLIWGCFLICVIASRYISLGSVVGAAAFPVGSILIFRDPVITVISIVMGVLVIFKHRGNLVRLIKGTESKFTLKWGSKQLGKKEKTGEAQPVSAQPVAESGETAGSVKPETEEEAQP